MKTQLTLFIFFVCFVLKAQDNPYASFGYESKVKYETNISSLLTVHNADTNSIHKKIAFDFERKFVYYLNENDSILETDSFEGDNIMVWLSVDPLAAEYPSLSPYAFVADNPVENKEVDGRYFVDANGKKVKFRKKRDGTLWISRNGRFNGRDKDGNKVKSDLGFLVGLVNESGSETAIEQVFEAANNSTMIHVKTSDEIVGLYGLHQAT
ncbi:hypothetical protein ACE193_20015 [Bernardetia sp. OM2101]|uniref:hypothetical protein n=1 Tax=Bernardetia sp. OM2101 TaxID=3344876 RepID=UPI0035CF895A